MVRTTCFCSVFLLAAPSIFSQTVPFSNEFKSRGALFEYDRNAGFNIKEVPPERQGDVVIRDIAFEGVPGKREVKAYVISPVGKQLCAGILWVHWLGEDRSNRTQFLEEAVELAPRGAVSLLVDAMWSDSGWYHKRIPEKDFENSIRQVVELRRALDLLLSQPNVDKSRIGFVGHDYGGMYGTLMAGVDQRPKTYVFIAVTPSLNDWAFFAPQPISKAEYLRRNAVLELTDYVHQIKNASVFFQFGKNDFYVSGASAAIYFRSANQPKERKVYDSEHRMDKPEIRSDRDAWLVKELDLKK